jgi:hypothetical protein
VPQRSIFNGIFMLKPLFAALLLSLPALAQANFLDAYELKARCLSERADAVNTCLGYLSGVADSDNGAPARAAVVVAGPVRVHVEELRGRVKQIGLLLQHMRGGETAVGAAGK